METQNLFCEGLAENNTAKLLSVPKSDIHIHSTKGCRRAWLEERIGRRLSPPPERFDGLAGMQAWFTGSIKPYCSGREGIVLRWEGAFAEAKRNHIARLAMNFGPEEIELVGGMETFRAIIESFCREYCPDTVFEPEITYVSMCSDRPVSGRRFFPVHRRMRRRGKQTGRSVPAAVPQGGAVRPGQTDACRGKRFCG